ncbi:plasmid mobilization relaxosome protein MobC [Actinocorallia libanotica]|uniref:Bacterial mobilisation domain-containing protein n=1 Tax=Actinocorallia libanotica TaxID=46162 RepID=A0ABN1S013_9ACTN
MAQRRRRVPGGRRHQHLVRFDDAEQTIVAAAAAEAGLTVPHFIAETVLLAVRRRDRLSIADRLALSGQLGAHQRLLRALGNNINQLARTANSTGTVPAEIAPALRAVVNLVDRMGAFLDDLEGLG